MSIISITFNIPKVKSEKVNSQILKILNKSQYKIIEKSTIKFEKQIVLKDNLNNNIKYIPITLTKVVNNDLQVVADLQQKYYDEIYNLLNDNACMPEDVIKEYGITASLIPLDEFICQCIIKSNKDGFISSSQAFEKKIQSTGDYVYNNFFILDKPSEEEITKAKDIIKFIITKSDFSDFFIKLKTAANFGFVDNENKNIAASMHIAYSKENKELNIKHSNKFFGKPGEKFNLLLKFVGKINKQTAFGELYIYNFLNTDNCLLTWLTSKEIDFEENVCYNIKGNIKEHSVFNFENKTVINYCKVIE